MEDQLESNPKYSYLSLSAQNPLFSQNAAQNYANQYYQMAIAPSIAQDAISQYLGGNLGGAGTSTFGATALGQEAATGLEQSFFAGQQYRDDQINNVLNERNALYGQDINTAQQQNENNINAALNQDQLNQSALNSENQFNLGESGNTNQYNLGAAGQLSNNYNSAFNNAFGLNSYNQNLQLQANEANAQNTDNLLTGGLANGIGAAAVAKKYFF